MKGKANDMLVIGIVNWNSYKLTYNSIKSVIEKNPSIKHRFVVIDNNSSNKQGKDLVLELIGHDNLIENETNVGFGRANNQVIEMYPGKDILILNPDTLQTNDSITKAWKKLQENAHVGIIGIRHIDHQSGGTQLSAFLFGSPWFQIFNILGISRLVGDKSYVNQDQDQDVDWVTGSFMLVKGQVVQETGGFDPDIFLNNEDVEWCIRIKKAGWKIRYFSSLSFRHIGGGTRHFMKDSRFSFVRSHLQFLWKTNSYLPFLVYYFLNLLICLKAIAIQVIKVLGRSSTRRALLDEINRFFSILILRPVFHGC